MCVLLHWIADLSRHIGRQYFFLQYFVDKAPGIIMAVAIIDVVLQVVNDAEAKLSASQRKDGQLYIRFFRYIQG